MRGVGVRVGESRKTRSRRLQTLGDLPDSPALVYAGGHAQQGGGNAALCEVARRRYRLPLPAHRARRRHGQNLLERTPKGRQNRKSQKSLPHEGFLQNRPLVRHRRRRPQLRQKGARTRTESALRRRVLPLRAESRLHKRPPRFRHAQARRLSRYGRMGFPAPEF